MRILVCDDVPDNLTVLVEILNTLGFEILTADNGKACVEVARHSQPDAVLLDLFMPEPNGFETVRALRALPGFQETPIVAVSGDAFVETREKSLATGCNAHLTKPLNFAELTETLDNLLPLTWEYGTAPDKTELDENELRRDRSDVWFGKLESSRE